MQIIKELIAENNNLKTIYLQTYAVKEDGTYKHSIALTHSNIRAELNNPPRSREESEKLRMELTRLSETYSQVGDFKINNALVDIFKNPDFYKDNKSTEKLVSNLTSGQIMQLNLLMAPGDRLWGYAANYAQLCPTRCGRLFGSYDSQTRTFALKGYSK
jgi:hypothetical protein